MKATEYIKAYTKKCSNELEGVERDINGKYVPVYQPWLTVENALEAVRLAKEEARQEVMRDMPKWKRCEPSFYTYVDDSIMIEEEVRPSAGNPYISTSHQRLRKGNYYIPIVELEKLPKEE